MKYFVRILSLSPIVFLVSLFLATSALALPPFPSSFYGTVKVNGANVPDGTVVQAFVGGQVYAEGHTQTYQGDSVFTLDITGDDTETTAIDGGRDGDTIQFKIGGLPADQTAVWHGGTNVVLHLTVTSSKPISKPPAIPTSAPTQTEIVILVRPSSTPSTSAQSLPAVTVTSVPASSIATDPAQSLHVVTTNMQASSTQPASPQNDRENRSGNISTAAVVVIALPIITAIGYTFLTLRKKRT